VAKDTLTPKSDAAGQARDEHCPARPAHSALERRIPGTKRISTRARAYHRTSRGRGEIFASPRQEGGGGRQTARLTYSFNKLCTAMSLVLFMSSLANRAKSAPASALSRFRFDLESTSTALRLPFRSTTISRLGVGGCESPLDGPEAAQPDAVTSDRRRGLGRWRCWR
jgi:hypothetical protein